MKRQEILENRKKWVEFLKSPEIKKTTGMLENIDQSRCCLGHGCYALGIEREVTNGVIFYEEEDIFAPEVFIEKVGLRGVEGKLKNPYNTEKRDDINSLVELNDETSYSPQQIGEFIEQNITGEEENSPFKPLKDYDE